MTILTIKLGALGDVVLAEGAMRAIREHHAGERHVVLTQPAFAGLVESFGLTDRVIGARRAKLFEIGEHWKLRKALRSLDITRVYDLQLNDRTGLIRRLLVPAEWSGVGKGASHPHPLEHPKSVHSVERHRLQLQAAGIREVPDPRVEALDGDLSPFGLPERYVLMVPGAAPSRPLKRWPAGHYGQLATRLADEGATPILLGTQSEASVTSQIAAAEPRVLDLTGKTGLGQIAALGRTASGAVGNDTGPMHIIALTGCPTVSLFGPDSVPELHRPLGERVSVLSAPSIEDIAPPRVRATLSLR